MVKALAELHGGAVARGKRLVGRSALAFTVWLLLRAPEEAALPGAAKDLATRTVASQSCLKWA